jgi:hypothetical protein
MREETQGLRSGEEALPENASKREREGARSLDRVELRVRTELRQLDDGRSTVARRIGREARRGRRRASFERRD